MKHKLWLTVGILVAVLLLVVIVNLLVIKYNGRPVPVPNIPRDIETYGNPADTPVSYVVMGDSTAVGQGGDYDRGIARVTARHIAQDKYVALQNVAVSGARADDVADGQLAAAVRIKPDIVLIAVGANDVTHFTSVKAVRQSLIATIDGLRTANPSVVLILTGSPQMGAVPRFWEPARSLATIRTANLNRMIEDLSKTHKFTFAPIARETGPTFRQHPELFAQDKFHPGTNGYEVWVPVLLRAFDEAL